jgi:CheY-like chemotaxis protein
MTNVTRTVLLVDDDEDFRIQMEMHLQAAGFTVVAVDGAQRAEEKLKELHPDLAVVDLMMERMDAGFALSRRLKQLVPPVPVIMVTGVTAETGISFDLTSGDARSWIQADAVLAKPVRFEQLRREIARLLKE